LLNSKEAVFVSDYEGAIPWQDGVSLVNATGLPDHELANLMPGVMAEVGSWISHQTYTHKHRNEVSMFNRTAYVAPNSPYSLFHATRHATENDDIVGGVCDAASALAFQGMKFEGDNSDDADCFNQIAADLDLDTVIRQWFREDYMYSQAVIGIWWGRKEYTVRGYDRTPEKPEKATEKRLDGVGNETSDTIYKPAMDDNTGKPKKAKKTKRRKKYDVTVPIRLTFFDPQRIVPLSPDIFGRDRLAWQSDLEEVTRVARVKNGEMIDPALDRFFLSGEPVQLNYHEASILGGYGVDTNNLLLLNPDAVFRVAPTRISYERFAPIKLKSVLPYLDLKQQLISSDRVGLVGQTNYILLVRIGTKEEPATKNEITGTRAGFRTVAQVPVVVADHRLTIDIITPDQSYLLEEERYAALDRRITSRCLGALSDVESGTFLPSVRAIQRGLEEKRRIVKRLLEKTIVKATVDHPANVDKFKSEPNVGYTPRHVQVDNDSAFYQAVINLRNSKELSRHSTLDLFGYDQDTEAQWREHEEESGLDDIFQTAVPFSSPEGAMGAGGPQGGRPPGGGATPQNANKAMQKKTANGNPSTKGRTK
jgi:hypothetical protein